MAFVYFSPSNACTVLASTVISPSDVAENRVAVRAQLFDRFPALARVFHRDTDKGTAASYATSRDDDSDGHSGDDDDNDAEVTQEHVRVLLQLIDSVVFSGSLSMSMTTRGWHTELMFSDAPRDIVRFVQWPNGQVVPIQERAAPVGIEIQISARTPDTYCFKHPESPPVIFGVPCVDALDCVMVQAEHQLVHAALLVGGCAEADPNIVAALNAAAAAPSLASIAVVLDTLPHTELMATACANLFGHTTPLHGPHVWTVPLGPTATDGRPPCCMQEIPRYKRAIMRPDPRIDSLWRARSDLRNLIRSGLPHEALVFDVDTATWTAGWRVARVSRWYAEVVSVPSCAAPAAAVRHVPIPFVRTITDRSVVPRLSDEPMTNGFWGTLMYGGNALLLPEPMQDMRATAMVDEAAVVARMSEREASRFAESFTEGLRIVSVVGPADEWGRAVSVQVDEAGTTLDVPADRILPLSLVQMDPRAP